MEETCLLDTVESFLSVTCIVPNYKNITTLFNFVVNSKCVSDLQLAAVKKKQSDKFKPNLILSERGRQLYRIFIMVFQLLAIEL